MEPIGCSTWGKHANTFLFKNLRKHASFQPKHSFTRHKKIIISRKCQQNSRNLAAHAAATSTPTVPSNDLALPNDVRDATAILNVGDTEVYILGISHVSKVALDHIRDLIAAVQPDTVVVELCKDRTGLLLNPDGPPPQHFYAPSVSIIGYNPQPGWPTQQTMVARLKSADSRPVSASDIEDDALALLATGLFGSVRPVTRPSNTNGALAFKVAGGSQLDPIAPLGAMDFIVTERKLPALSDFKIEFSNMENGKLLPEEDLEAIKTAALRSAGGAAAPTVAALLTARTALKQKLAEKGAEGVDVSFSGVESGNVVATVAVSGLSKEATGLEGTAVGGRGVGIQIFQRQTPPKTPQMNLENDSSDTGNKRDGIAIVPWSRSELAAAGGASTTTARGGGLENAFAGFLTQKYSKYQTAAGNVVGVSSGAAWQVALEAAAKCRTRVVLLGDRPASITGLRLARGIWRSSSSALLGALAATVGAVVAVEGPMQGNPTVAVASAATVVAAFAAALWPVAAPLLEIRRFSQMSASQIEETVRLKEPLQSASPGNLNNDGLKLVALWGEDALIKWPGAMESIINERDEYMARAIVAAASGKNEGFTPAYITAVSGLPGEQEGASSSFSSGADVTWYRYAMPQGGDPGVCPVGDGDGRFEMPAARDVRRIVAVVGTAHVRGMMKIWPAVTQPSASLKLSEFLNIE